MIVTRSCGVAPRDTKRLHGGCAHLLSIVSAAGEASTRTAVSSLKQYEDTAVRLAKSPGLREMLQRKIGRRHVGGDSDAVLFRPDLLVSDLERSLRAAVEARRDHDTGKMVWLGGKLVAAAADGHAPPTATRTWRHVMASHGHSSGAPVGNAR